MPGVDGMSLLRQVRKKSPETGVIIITAFGEVATAVDAMRLGAYDYLGKPVDLKRLHLSLQHLLDNQDLIAENKELRAKLEGDDETDLTPEPEEVLASDDALTPLKPLDEFASEEDREARTNELTRRNNILLARQVALEAKAARSEGQRALESATTDAARSKIGRAHV